MPSLDELQSVLKTLPAGLPKWNGDVRLNAWLLPYDSTDRETGERMTVHAVIVDRVMFVSRQAWDALLTLEQRRQP